MQATLLGYTPEPTSSHQGVQAIPKFLDAVASTLTIQVGDPLFYVLPELGYEEDAVLTGDEEIYLEATIQGTANFFVNFDN